MQIRVSLRPLSGCLRATKSESYTCTRVPALCCIYLYFMRLSQSAGTLRHTIGYIFYFKTNGFVLLIRPWIPAFQTVREYRTEQNIQHIAYRKLLFHRNIQIPDFAGMTGFGRYFLFLDSQFRGNDKLGGALSGMTNTCKLALIRKLSQLSNRILRDIIRLTARNNTKIRIQVLKEVK